jgi:hypothetical protein
MAGFCFDDFFSHWGDFDRAKAARAEREVTV